MTNNHVVDDPDFGTAHGRFTVEIPGDSVAEGLRPPVPAELVIRNEEKDLAILQAEGIEAQGFIDVFSGPSIDDRIMECPIRILGYPIIDGNVLGGTLTVTRGIVSGFYDSELLKTDAEINQGNSGGAVLDDFGTFIGVPSSMAVGQTGKIGLIISANCVRKWIHNLFDAVPEDPLQLTRLLEQGEQHFSSGNLDQSSAQPRLLGKFAAVERLLANREYSSVIAQVDFIIGERPRSALAHHYKGHALLGLEDFIGAAQEFRTALQLNPYHIQTIGNLGIALARMGRNHEALQTFEALLEATDDPEQTCTALRNVANIYRICGREDIANRYMARFEGLRPKAEE